MSWDVGGSLARHPQVRASIPQESLLFLDAVRPGLQAAVRKRMRASSQKLIDSAQRSDWLPLEETSSFVDAVVAELGPEAAEDFFRRLTLERLVKTPILRPIVQGVLRIFGASVGAVARGFPAGFGQSYRDVCELRVDAEDDVVTLVFDDPAEEVFEHDYPLIYRGVFLSFFDIAGVEPDLDFRVDKAARRITATLRV